MIDMKQVPDATKISVRLKCAEIVYATGSQHERADLDKIGEKLYNFVLGIKEKK